MARRLSWRKSGKDRRWSGSRAGRRPERAGRSCSLPSSSDRAGEGRILDGLQRQVDAGDLVFGAAERPEDEHVLLGLGKDDPLPAAGFYKRVNSIGHGVPPGFLEEYCGEIISNSGKYVP